MNTKDIELNSMEAWNQEAQVQTGSKKKIYVLTVSKQFMKGHPRAGEPTGFKEKILSGEKIHTIRHNYAYWKKVADAVNAGTHILSVREWSGKPYNSPQVEFLQLDRLGIQPVTIVVETPYFKIPRNSYFSNTNLTRLAAHDGLSLQDFKDWFRTPPIFKGGIIHFADFQY